MEKATENKTINALKQVFRSQRQTDFTKSTDESSRKEKKEEKIFNKNQSSAADENLNWDDFFKTINQTAAEAFKTHSRQHEQGGQKKSYLKMIKALEQEKKALEEKLKELSATADQDYPFMGDPEKNMQELIREYNEIEKQDRLLGIMEMEIFFPDLMKFLNPYFDKHKDLELPEVIEKIPQKDKKKFAAEMWTKNREEIKGLLHEKIHIYRKLAALSNSVDKLSHEKFDDFAKQVIEARYLDSLPNSAETVKRLTKLTLQNGRQELSNEAS